MHRRITILGSTGSIGCAALDVIAALGSDFQVAALAAGRDWRKLAEQSRRFNVAHVAIADERAAGELRCACGDATRVHAGAAGLVEMVREVETDLVLAAIVGAGGLASTLAAVERGVDVALANKESLVVAGSVIVPLAARTGSRLLPVDSEHSAVFQAMQAGRREEVAKIYLTASGGPFRTWSTERIASATLEDALRHPTWRMGPKVTIDSATMMNKALEVIEAVHLFGVTPDEIEVLVHPEAIVHSMVEFRDGSVVAQLGAPDMKTPIQYALTYPRRAAGIAPRLSWRDVRRLSFEPPDLERFPLLRLGFDAARHGGTSGSVFNAANEAAVERFRAGEIPFGSIADLVEQVYGRRRTDPKPGLEELLAADAWARREVSGCRVHS
ncbi:MAG: 1-deoxy-D-xylulose-5-phosphate reductoisomerase [Phycisphaerae bacterium]